MPSEELEFVDELLRSFSLEGLTVAEQRAAMERGASAPADGTLVEPVDANGVPAEWVTGNRVTGKNVVLSLHGGAYALGSLATNRRFSALLSAATNRRVLSIDYRLAPEHRFPAALDDSLTAYRWLLNNHVAAQEIVIAGNSAGGGLTLATLIALRGLGVPLPAAAVAVSAWTDLTGSGESISSCAASDAMLSPHGLATSAAMYADVDQLVNPLVSPLFVDLKGLPPILLQASRTELLRDDTTRFAAHARSCGVKVTEELYADMPHVFHLFAGVLPEAALAFASIGRWLASIEVGA